MVSNRISYKIARCQLQMEANVRDNRNETLKAEGFRGLCCVEMNLQSGTVLSLSHPRDCVPS